MYELIQITENCYYIDCPSKIGVVKIGQNEVCLIDSGNNKDVGKKIKKILDANGWNLKAIYNTHSNADHIGANRYLAEQTGCKIFARDIECALTRHTILEPAYLYGGYPPKELRSKFFVAEQSDAEYLSEENLPDGFKIIKLDGHFFSMVGFLTPDGVAYIADCLSSKQTLDKYGIGVIYDVKAYLNSLEEIKNLKAEFFVPSHAEVGKDITALADYNIKKVKETADKIVEFAKEPIIFEELLKKLFDFYGLCLSVEQYALVGSTVRSYLSYLKEENILEVKIEDNRLLWQKVLKP